MVLWYSPTTGLSATDVRDQWSSHVGNSSSVNPLPLPDIMEVDSLGGKRSDETTNQDSHCHGYALFPCSFEY